VAVEMRDEDRLDCRGVEACRRHALEKPAVPVTIDWVSTCARVDQDHLIAQLERHDDKPKGHLIVGKTGRAGTCSKPTFLTMPRSGSSRTPSIREKTSMSPTSYLRKGWVTDSSAKAAPMKVTGLLIPNAAKAPAAPSTRSRRETLYILRPSVGVPN